MERRSFFALRVGLFLSAVLMAVGVAIAENKRPADCESADAADQVGEFDLRTARRLTGDWGGVRTDIEDAGFKITFKLMNQIMTNMHGGAETKNGHDTAGSYEMSFYLDFEKMGLIEDAWFFIQAEGNWGGDDSDFDKEKVGGLFKTNQDAKSEEPLFVDLWYWAQSFADDKLELRFGRLLLLKSFFDTSKVIGCEDTQFMNRALVYNATIPLQKGLSLYVNYDITEQLYVRAAAMDIHSRNRQTNFNTAFHDEDEFRFHGEVGYRPKFSSARGDLWGHYRVGTWYDPGRREEFFDTAGGVLASRHSSGHWGFYIGFDQMVWKESDEPSGKQGLTIAGRYGQADGTVYRIDRFWSLAGAYEGIVPGRDRDVLGLGFGQGIVSDEYGDIHERADRESVYELYYSIHVKPYLTITPDLQFITNTGGHEDDPDTFVGGVRFKMSF